MVELGAVVGRDGRRAGERRWRIWLLSLLLVGLLCLPRAAAEAARATSIIVDYETGTVLSASNPDAAVYPASLTKTMTLYLAFEALRSGRLALTDKLDVSARAAGMSPSKLGLKAGSTIQVQDAIFGMLTKSANDAAVVLGEELGGGSEAGFARVMTEKAAQLGMTRTVFKNASGLPNPDQRTTARDMARLGVRMIQDFPEYYDWFSTRQFTFRGRVHANHNHLMKRYQGMDGLKTGYIRASGFNLLASAVRDERRLVGAVFGGTSARARDDFMAKLLDRGFAQVALASAGKLSDEPGAPDDAGVLLASAVPDPRNLAQGDDDEGEATLSVDKPMVLAALPSVPRVTPKLRPADPAQVSASKALAAKKAVAVAKVKAKGGYGVQVGAFKSSRDASRASVAAIKKAPTLLYGKPTQVSAVKNRQSTIYRAWLTGFGQSEAVSACKQLKKQGQDCMVFKASR